MRGSPPDSALTAPLPLAADTAAAPVPSHLEEEVIGLFDQLRDRLLRYALSIGVSVHDGEEIVQEVFLSLFRHLRLQRSRANLRGWLFRVAHNLALKQRNRDRRSAPAADDAIAENQSDPAPGPEEQLASNQRRRRLLAVLRVLPEQDQHCLYLRAEGLRYREIADVLGISLGSVSISLTRSIARLGRADRG